MASWKKILVSGSAAELSAITASNLTNDNILVAGTGGALEASGITYDGSALNLGSSTLTSTGASSVLSGSFSGSFEGDGSSLTGLVSTLDISGSTGAGSVSLKTQDLSFTGTTGEITSAASGQSIDLRLASGSIVNAKLANTGSVIGNTSIDLGATVTTIDGLTLTDVLASGSFSGSYSGDGSALTGLNLSLQDQNGITDEVDLGSDTLTFSGSNGFDFAVTENKLTLNSPQRLGTTDSPTFGTGSFAGLVVGDLNVTGITNGNQLQSGAPLRFDTANVEILSPVSSSFIPDVHQAFSLGSDSKKWLQLHAREAFLPTANIGTISGSGATLTVIGDAIDIDATAELSIDAANAVTITSTNSTVTVEGTTFDGNNVTIPGNLYVQGTQTNLNTSNLDIEDKFIFVGSGSTDYGDSGVIFGGSISGSAANSGSALIWDASYNSNDGRLAVVNELASSATGNQTPNYHVAGVYEGNATNAATAQADHPGNIRIDNDEIFIYV